MMMKLWKRIAIEAFAVLGLVGDVLLMYNFGGRNCVLSLVLGLVLAAYCALVFMIALRSGQVRQARMITLRHESGDVVLLSQETLDHLVASAVGQPEGVSDMRVITGYHDESLEVMIDVSVSSNINIPVTTARMQEAVRHQLGDVSGIALSGVSVKISTIKVPGEGEAIVPPQTVKPEEEPCGGREGRRARYLRARAGARGGRKGGGACRRGTRAGARSGGEGGRTRGAGAGRG